MNDTNTPSPEFKITKEPIMQPQSAPGRSKYPWAQMEVGSTFIAESKSQASLTANARYWALSHGHPDWKFRTKDLKDGTIKIQRIA